MKDRNAFSRLLLAGLVVLFTFSGADLPAMPRIQRTVLPNQLVLLAAEDRSLPFATLELLVKAGSWMDPPGKEGLANLAAVGLLLGTRSRASEEIDEKLDFLGADLQASGSRDFATLKLKILKKNLKEGLALLGEILAGPQYPEDELKREIKKIMGTIREAQDDPMAVAEKEFRNALYLNSPYAHPVRGTLDSLPSITREDVRSFFEQYYRPNNSVLAVTGDISPEEIKTGLGPLVENWSAGNIKAIRPEVGFARGPETVKVQRKLSQANIILGHEGVRRSNPDYYPLILMNYILGGASLSSRLMQEVRSQRGLAYSVSSFFEANKYGGSFQAVLQTKSPSAKEVVSIVRREMERLKEEDIPKKELETAKKYLVGSFPLRLDTQEELAGLMTRIEYFDLGLDYPGKYFARIQSVTPEEIRRAARTYLHPHRLILVVVADLQETGME